MIEQYDPKRLFNKPLAGIDDITLPVKDLEVAKQFYAGVLGGEVVFGVDSSWLTARNRQQNPHTSVIVGNSPKLTTGGSPAYCPTASDISKGVILPCFWMSQARASSSAESRFIPELKPLDFHAFVPLYNASLVSYQQRWQGEIASRFREAKKRFPEFFPCFELLESPGTGLQYSIHFEPLTGHAKALIEQTPLFPHQREFKPIEKLWHEDGSSELDILFERFPTQLVLLPKQLWGTRLWKLLLELVHRGLELRHIGSLLARQKA